MIPNFVPAEERKDPIKEKAETWLSLHGSDLDGTFEGEKALAEYSAALQELKDTPQGKAALRKTIYRLREISKTKPKVFHTVEERLRSVLGAEEYGKLLKAYPPNPNLRCLLDENTGNWDYYETDPKKPHLAFGESSIMGVDENADGKKIVRPLSIKQGRGPEFGALLYSDTGKLANQETITELADHLAILPLQTFTADGLRSNLPFLAYAVAHARPGTWDLTMIDKFAQGIAALTKAEVNQNLSYRAAPAILEKAFENLGGDQNLLLEQAPPRLINAVCLFSSPARTRHLRKMRLSRAPACAAF